MTPDFVERYQGLFESDSDEQTPDDQVRFVVLDAETTGLNPKTDHLVTIGAIAVVDGEIRLDDSYESMLKVRFNTASVTVHGVTREESLEGQDEPAALEDFLDYLRDGVIVGHHILHDISTFNAAYDRHFGFTLKNRFIDTMSLMLHLEQDGAFESSEPIKSFSLDSLCTFFGIKPYGRHTAPGDAFLTAQIFLRLLRLSQRFGRTTLEDLAEPWDPPEERK